MVQEIKLDYYKVLQTKIVGIKRIHLFYECRS